MKRFGSVSLLAILFPVVLTFSAVAQRPETAASLLPGSTVVYVEIPKPADLIDRILEHPVSISIQDNKQFKQLLASPQFAAALLGQALIEQQIGEPLLDSVKTNMGGGLYLGFDARTEGAFVLFKSKDKAKLKRLAGSILKFVGAQAARDNKALPYKRETYRNAQVAKFDNLLIARYESWFLISTQPELAKSIVDNMHDGSTHSLADQDWFQAAIQNQDLTDAWAALNLEPIRNSKNAAELFSGNTNNPGVELVFGGVLDALQHAPVAIAKLDLAEDLKVSVSLPFKADWARDARKFFFGTDLKGRGPLRLEPTNMIASLTSYRDVSAWWLSKEELFEENVIAQLTQAESQLTTIFSGMDFGQDVLGALEPGVQIVVTRNEYDEAYVPDIRLPAFAIVGKLKDPEKVRRRLKVAFQSVIGFANINLGMQGQPQLDLESESVGNAKISSASYVYDDDTEKGLLLFNFAPTVAFQGDHIIISSSRELAVELTQLTEKSDGNCDSNTLLHIDGMELCRILGANLEPLIAQNMIEEGHDRKTAANEIASLLALVGLIKESVLDFRVEADEMRLDLTIRTVE